MCVAFEDGEHRIQCARHGLDGDSFGALADRRTFHVFPRKDGTRWVMTDTNQAGVQVTTSTTQTVRSIYGKGCAVCAIVDGLTPGSTGDVRCFGCDGEGYTLFGNSARGTLGYGMDLTGPVGSSDYSGNVVAGYAATARTHYFAGSQCGANTASMLEFTSPTAHQEISIEEGPAGRTVVQAAATPSAPGATVYYWLDGAFPDSSKFTCDPMTGEVTINDETDFESLSEDERTFELGLLAF